MLKRFLSEIKKYYPYIQYAAKCDLKSEVAGSHLNWLWWILDPFCFMLVYMFIALVVFGKDEPYFPAYVFIGLTLWNFFSKNISGSVLLVKKYKSMIAKVYIPKYILILQKIWVNFFKMLVSFILVGILILIYGIHPSILYFNIIPIFAVLMIVTFGICAIFMHLGVYIADLANITTVLLRLLMYLSGIFYSLETRVPAPYNEILLKLNPIAFLMKALRDSLLYNVPLDVMALTFWLLIGVILSVIGVFLIYKYENSYIKVI